VTGILLCINKVPVKWYCKRQNTVESSTYGAELVAARIAVEMIMEFRYKLRMMGVKIDGPSVMLVDNEAVVMNTTLPSSTLKKKHNAIAYHKVREAVAAGIIRVAHIKSHMNVADILTKPLSPQAYYQILKWILFKRDSSENQGELQEVQVTNRTQNPTSDSQASSPGNSNPISGNDLQPTQQEYS